jgi:HSP20 family protein
MFELIRTFSTASGSSGHARPVDPVARAWADLALPALGLALAAPPADVVETADAIVVRLDLPGHRGDDIRLKVENDVLTVEAERKLGEPNGETFHRSERTFGRSARSFALPAGVDTARTEAAYTDGVLEIKLPKREEAKPRTIQVKVAK